MKWFFVYLYAVWAKARRRILCNVWYLRTSQWWQSFELPIWHPFCEGIYLHILLDLPRPFFSLIFVLLKYIFKNKVMWLEWDNFLHGLHLEKGLTLDLKPIWCPHLSWMHKSVFYLSYLSSILVCCWLNCSSFTLR